MHVTGMAISRSSLNVLLTFLCVPLQVMCTDAVEARPIVIESGAMVADRCVLLPGVRVGRNSVLGSGTLATKGFEAPAGSVWLGSSGGKPTLWQVGLLFRSWCTLLLCNALTVTIATCGGHRGVLRFVQAMGWAEADSYNSSV
jgi:hypothetical protein